MLGQKVDILFMLLPTTVHIFEPTTTQVERILELLDDKSYEIE